MIKDSSKLKRGQLLQVEVKNVVDRMPKDILEILREDPRGILIGYKMVDGNQFGLVLKLKKDLLFWFFEHELSLVEE